MSSSFHHLPLRLSYVILKIMIMIFYNIFYKSFYGA